MTFLFVAGEFDLSIGSHYGFLLILMSNLIDDWGIDPWLSAGIVTLMGGDRRRQRAARDPRRPAVVHHHARHADPAARGRQYPLERLPDPGQEHRPVILPDHPGRLPGHAVPDAVRRDGDRALVGGIVLARTKFGSDIYATGGDVEAARNNGIDTRR